MRSKTNFRVSFFLKRAKLLKNGEASVAMRITVDGQRVENNIRKSILPNLWDQSKERAKGTSVSAVDHERLRCRFGYLGELIKQKYGVDDLPLSDFTGEVIRSYEVYLKTEKDLCQNTLIRYMKALKKITNRCIANDWLQKDPFAGIKFREEPTDPEFLTLEEVDRIYNCNPGSKRLEVIKDMFLLSAFIGLAFTDVAQLTEEHIVADNDGNQWIRKSRQKTKQMSNIPLLDIPLAIIEKYRGDKKAAKKEVLLPIPCNQVMNRYLKEIAEICKINKHLTMHTARHTYAALCLSHGVSLKNVSKMLGHASVKKYSGTADFSASGRTAAATADRGQSPP